MHIYTLHIPYFLKLDTTVTIYQLVVSVAIIILRVVLIKLGSFNVTTIRSVVPIEEKGYEHTNCATIMTNKGNNVQ